MVICYTLPIKVKYLLYTYFFLYFFYINKTKLICLKILLINMKFVNYKYETCYNKRKIFNIFFFNIVAKLNVVTKLNIAYYKAESTNKCGLGVPLLLMINVCLLSIVSAFLPNSNIKPSVSNTKNIIIITNP